MYSKSAVISNIKNRSPWVVQVRAQPNLGKRFSATKLSAAQRHCEALCAQGLKAKLTQLETAYQLRVRRKGLAPQRYVKHQKSNKSERFLCSNPAPMASVNIAFSCMLLRATAQ